jgi:hypothetical protein
MPNSDLPSDLGEKDLISEIEESNNYAIYSKSDGTFMYNDGALIKCPGLGSPIIQLAQSSLQVEDEDLI